MSPAGGPDRTPVLIVRYRGDPRLESCLRALKAQRGVALDVVLVENAAGDGPPEPWLAPGGAVASLARVARRANPGFAAAFNEAWASARGDVVVSVNPDCRLDEGAIAAARTALDRDAAAGAVAFRLWRPGREALDSAGIRMSPLWLRAADRGRGGAGTGRFLEPASVDAACLAGAALRRTAVERARDGAGEVLDSRYFAYQEDVDLGWRLRRAGFRVLYEPRASGEHDRGWREGRRHEIPADLRRASLRNRWFTILKNLSWPALAWRLPFLIALEALLFARLVVFEREVLPAYGMILRGARESRARRIPSHDRGRSASP